MREKMGSTYRLNQMSLEVSGKKSYSSAQLCENLWNVTETAEYLSVSPKTVYDWVHKREIPYVKAKRLLRFQPTEIANWLQNGGHNGNRRN